MSINKIEREQMAFQIIKIHLLMFLMIVFSCEITFAAENVTIETKSGNLFENLVSDTILLLDPELKKIITDDFDHVVKNSKFELVVNSWKPRPNPRIRLATIYDRFNSNNIKESLSSLIQPVIEISCSSQKNDPLNEYQSKCIKNMFKYPVISKIEISYTYEPQRTVEQYIADLSGLNDTNRYQQMVRTSADIMNSLYEKVSKKNVTKSVNVVKYPLPIFSGSGSGVAKPSYSSTGSVCRKPSIGHNRKFDDLFVDMVNRNAAMAEYQHCLDMEKIKAGGNIGDINQRRQADEMRRMSGQMNASQAEMRNQQSQMQAQQAQQQAEMQRQQAEVQRMRDQQNFNNIWKK